MDTLTSILREQPVPPLQLNPQLPPELEWIIGKCLEKKPGERHQDTRDLVVDLRRLKRDSDSQAMGRAEPSARTVPGVPRHAVWTRTGIVAGVVVVLAAFAVGGWHLLRRDRSAGEAVSSFQSMKMTSLARIDGLVNAVLSPDARFLAYIARRNGRYSLWIRQVSTPNDIEILPPQEVAASGIGFSPDSERLYFLMRDPELAAYRALYEVPTLGGSPRKIVFDIDSPAAFSPDGKSIAFLRGQPYQTPPSVALMVADSDGAGPHTLATKPFGRFLGFAAPSWSPNGRRVAAVMGGAPETGHDVLAEFDLADGSESRIGEKEWGSIRALAWLPSGGGIAVIGGGLGETTQQVWFVAYPNGNARRITNDLNDYLDLSVSADGTTLATVQVTSGGDIWSAPAEDPAAANQIIFGEGGAPIPYLSLSGGGPRIAATLSGSIVFVARRGQVSQIWGSAPDGTGRRRLTPEGMDAGFPRVARAASTLVFRGSGTDRVYHVYRMDADGGNLAQLTWGEGETPLAISPDGRRAVYRKNSEGSLWETSTGGGPAARMVLPKQRSNQGAYGPDGRTVWVTELKQRAGLQRITLEEIPSDGGPPLRSLEWPKSCQTGSNWKLMPSSDALTCIGELDGVYNLWSQPLAGGEARPITHFKSGHVLDFDWSTDGKRLFLWRGDATTDVVLMSSVMKCFPLWSRKVSPLGREGSGGRGCGNPRFADARCLADRRVLGGADAEPGPMEHDPDPVRARRREEGDRAGDGDQRSHRSSVPAAGRAHPVPACSTRVRRFGARARRVPPASRSGGELGRAGAPAGPSGTGVYGLLRGGEAVGPAAAGGAAAD